MKLDDIIEMICRAFSERFDGLKIDAYTLTMAPPTNDTQVITATDHEGNAYRIEVSKI